MNGDSESCFVHSEEWAMLIRLKDCWQRNLFHKRAGTRTVGINGRDANASSATFQILAGFSQAFQGCFPNPFQACQKRDALVTTVGSLHILSLKHKEYMYHIYIYSPKNLTWNLKMQALVGQGDWTELGTDQFFRFLQKKFHFCIELADIFSHSTHHEPNREVHKSQTRLVLCQLVLTLMWHS